MADLRKSRDKQVKKQGNLCCYCQRQMEPADSPSVLRATLEHIYPRGHALRGTAFSRKAACYECNNRRGLLNNCSFLLPPICPKRQVQWFTCDPFWLPNWFRDPQ